MLLIIIIEERNKTNCLKFSVCIVASNDTEHCFLTIKQLIKYLQIPTTYIIVFMRLKVKFLRQREDLVVLLQECLAVFQLVEITGL